MKILTPLSHRSRYSWVEECFVGGKKNKSWYLGAQLLFQMLVEIMEVVFW